VISSNKLEPTTSSIPLAKRLAFLLPCNSRSIWTIQSIYAARRNKQGSCAWQRSAILGTEKIVPVR